MQEFYCKVNETPQREDTKAATVGPAIVYITDDVCLKCRSQIESELKEKYLNERLDIENNLQTKITLLQIEASQIEAETRQKCWEDIEMLFPAQYNQRAELKKKWGIEK